MVGKSEKRKDTQLKEKEAYAREEEGKGIRKGETEKGRWRGSGGIKAGESPSVRGELN